MLEGIDLAYWTKVFEFGLLIPLTITGGILFLASLRALAQSSVFFFKEAPYYSLLAVYLVLMMAGLSLTRIVLSSG